MLLSYLNIAFRQLQKNKTYVIISTLGMGIAIACCLTAYLLVAYNVEFDDFYEDRAAANVVKVLHTYENSDRERDQELASPMAIAPRILEDIADVEDYTRFCNETGIISLGPDAFYETIRFADASFLKMFGIRFKEGSTRSFEDPNTIILSQDLAKKYFGDRTATGNTLTVELNSRKHEVVVGGVLEKIPLNTSFHINALMRIEQLLDAYDIQPDDWQATHSAGLLLKLTDINKRGRVAQQMDTYVALRNRNAPALRSVGYSVVPFHEHIAKESLSDTELRMPIPVVALVIFCSLGGIILLIACFNLTNTTLAITSGRMKEIAVRKVVGSAKRQIAAQFFVEVVMMIAIAIATAVAMALVIVPRFAEMWELPYGLSDLNGVNIVLTLLGILVLISVVAGLYPSIYSSRLNAVTLFRGGSVKGTTALSRVLLTAQFALSVIVLIGGITFTKNAAHQAKMDFGYDHANLLLLSTPQGLDFERIQTAVLAQSSVVGAAGARNGIGPYTAIHSTFKIDTTSFKSDMYRVAPGYIGTAGLQLISGRDFSTGEPDLQSALVDQGFADSHGLADPLGTEIWQEDKAYRIVGVVSNHIRGFKQRDHGDYVYLPVEEQLCTSLLIRTQAGQTGTVKKSIERTWKDLFPGRPFQCEQQTDLLYQEAAVYNKNLKDIFFFLTVLGCMLSVSGIYSLASLNTNKRKKEIGIRKVLGASVPGIVRLLNREFVMMLSAAVLAGGFFGYLLTNALLSNLYKQFVGVDSVSLLLGAAIIFLLGVTATSATILKVAVDNPSNSLRSE
jgi:putative ABC transport system permease protein